ncbi:hypothetical protein ACJ73_05881 [Blastomyces percursus]|uniref:C2H2-type domain-containing protein n=1 Tax=Blastomyces percursus TaxID=1658174 RepID=A0A1J9Q2H9_9EURO|nr:hypothetical protein ACJ73_05881 [Blastomyces percursus]
MIKLSTNSSITRDPTAPHGRTPAQRRSVERDPNLMALERDRIEFRDALIAEYGTLSKIKDMTILQDYRQRCNKIRTTRRRLLKETGDKAYKDHFENIGDIIIEMNYSGEGCPYDPDTSSILPERKALAAIEFKNRDVNTVRRACGRHLASRPKALAEEILSNDKWSPCGLECPLCLNNDSFHPQAQQFSHCNKYVLKRLVEKTHLQHVDFSKAIRCSYLDCGKLLTSAEQSLCHFTTAHGTQLPMRWRHTTHDPMDLRNTD